MSKASRVAFNFSEMSFNVALGELWPSARNGSRIASEAAFVMRVPVARMSKSTDAQAGHSERSALHARAEPLFSVIFCGMMIYGFLHKV